MNHPVPVQLFHLFMKRGFRRAARFQLPRRRPAARGEFDLGDRRGWPTRPRRSTGLQSSRHPAASQFWVAGFDFGAWIGMQLLMRRPETDGFISVSPPTNMYDFSFLAPCPASGIILHGSADTVVPNTEVEKVVAKLRTQKGIVIDYELVEGGGHFWTDNLVEVETRIGAYLDKRLAAEPA